MTYDIHHNRLRSMRMRDSKRWTLHYRDAAWNLAVREARQRSFLGSILFAMSNMLEMAAETRAP